MEKNLNHSAQLIVLSANEPMVTFPIFLNDRKILGRAGGANDISINSPVVTAQHGMFLCEQGRYSYIDLGSTNGTYYNFKKMRAMPQMPSEPVSLHDGDILTIAPGNSNQVSVIVSLRPDDISWRSIPLNVNQSVTIGRNESNQIVVPNITASRNHAVVMRKGNRTFVQDLHSSNGTFVNGRPISGVAPLTDGATIQVGGTRILYLNGNLLYTVHGVVQSSKAYFVFDEKAKTPPCHKPQYDLARKGGVEIQVKHVSRIVGCKNGTGINGGNRKKILDDITLTIERGELVAILGGSGAGKTTFMNCINGFEPATEGTVLFDGIDLYKNYKSLKSRMGYVPQQDIVYDELTLKDMLRYTGKLRLPREEVRTTLDKRVAEAIDMVDLNGQRDTLIKKLSGGQKKRASIAVELLSDPQLMFLDEPTSGLDPEAETSLMTQLRRLSDNSGKTVVVVTHTLQNINLFDKVIFLAPGGKLCFYGSPEEAAAFFEVENLTDAYKKIAEDIDGYVQKFDRYRNGG